MPIRTCIGCRTAKPDADLIRVVTVDGKPVIGLPGRGGRGAWLCPRAQCVGVAGARKAFSRAFRARTADDHFAATLMDWLAEQGQS